MLSCSWRLAQLKQDSVLTLYDAANAVGSMCWPLVLEATQELSEEWTHEIHNEQIAQQCFELESADGQHTFACKGSITMGRGIAPRTFVRGYNKKLRDWNSELLRDDAKHGSLIARDVVSGRAADFGTTVFVDDIARTTTTPQRGKLAEETL